MNSTQEKFGLDPEVISKILKVLYSNSKVDQVILYGSRAKGNFKKGSDIDLTLKGEEVNSHLVFNLETQLDDLMLPYLIDLSAYGEINNPSLIEHIDRVGILLKPDLI